MVRVRRRDMFSPNQKQDIQDDRNDPTFVSFWDIRACGNDLVGCYQRIRS
jgi:hypothetical protein